MEQLLILIGTTLLAGFVQGLTGFGSILISLPILAIFFPFKTLIPLISLFALCINIAVAAQLWKNIPYRQLAPLLAGTLPGVYLGVSLLSSVPEQALILCLGLLITSFSAFSLTGHTIQLRSANPIIPICAGFLAGGLGGSIGANGPPIIIYSSILAGERDKMKALMCSYFLFAGIGISSMHAYKGFLTSEVLHLFTIGLPAVAAGILLGTILYKRIGETTYRKSVYTLILLLGVMMLKQGLNL